MHSSIILILIYKSWKFLVKCPIDDETQTARHVPAEAFLKDDKECTGSLILNHSSQELLGNYHRLYLSEKDEYKNIRRKFPILKNNIIVGMNVVGTCCWEVFPTRKHKGDTSEVLFPDTNYLPKFQIISARKTICDDR